MLENLVGKRVRWEAAGRGRGTLLEGEVALTVQPGETNGEALERLRALKPGLVVRRKYCRFADDTFSTPRAFVLVEQATARLRPVFWIYAPNVNELISLP